MARIHGGDAAVRDCSVRRRGRRARTARRRGGRVELYLKRRADCEVFDLLYGGETRPATTPVRARSRLLRVWGRSLEASGV